MGPEKNSFGYYSRYKVFYSHFDYFADAAEKLMHDTEKDYALMYISMSNINIISNVFGVSAGFDSFENAVCTICRCIEDKGFVFGFYTNSILAFIGYDGEEELLNFVKKIETEVNSGSFYDSHNFSIEIVTGIYLFKDEISIKNAADQLFVALNNTAITSGHFFYDSLVHARVSKELEIVKSVDEAIENGEFQIFLQPQHYLQHEDRVLSAEALIRWIRKDGTIIYPGDFIPILEKNGLITKLDCHVMELACKYISKHLDDEWFEGIVISVNVSKIDLRLKDFIEYYTNIRKKYNIPDGRIEIEFTESAVFEDYSVFKQIMFGLKKSGFYCSIDDFGTGSSSLNMLKSMPVDVLKMDRMFFVCENENDTDKNNSVIASVVAMARGLGMKIVAEGIELPEKIDFLRKIGCDVIQGYVYSKPLSLDDFEAYVKNYIPKYLPISEKLNPIIPAEDDFDDGEAIYQKYVQVLPYVNAFVMDLDIEQDVYKIISFGQDKVVVSEPSGEYSSFFENQIMQNIHEDFRSDASKYISLKGILSAFYRGDSETEFEMQMKFYDADDTEFSEESQYRWCLCRIYFQKISKRSKPMATIFLSDIQEQKEKELSILSAERRLKETINGLVCEIYDYDIKERKALLLHTGIKKNKSDEMGSGHCIEDFENYINEYVHKDDRKNVINILKSIEAVNFAENEDYYAEYRVRNMAGDIRWKSIHFMIDNESTKENATIILNDIDERKISELRKERNERRDKNSGVYTLGDFYDIVQEFTERDGRTGEHIMLMASIYDFRNISLKHGYQYGTELEAAFIKCMKRSIRKDDIIGRFGSGRFIIFLKGIGSDFVDRFISKTKAIFENEKFNETELKDFCMGISLLVNSDKSVQQMSNETIKALEDAENSGKGHCCLYNK